MKNMEGNIIQGQTGFSWTVFFFHFWPMVFRRDWKWASISFAVWLAPLIAWIWNFMNIFGVLMNELPDGWYNQPEQMEYAMFDAVMGSGLPTGFIYSSLLFYLFLGYFVFMAFTYNKRHLKRLLHNGYEPASEVDAQILEAKLTSKAPEIQEGKGFLPHVNFSRAKGVWALVLFFFAGQLVFPLIFLPLLVALGVSEEASWMSWLQFLVSGTNTVIFLFMFGKHFVEEWRRVGSKLKLLGGIVVGYIAVVMASAIGGLLVQLIYPGADDMALNQQLIESMIFAHPVLWAFSIIIFAIVTEEVVFRLVMMKWMDRWPWVSILVSSLIFGLLHVIMGDFHFLIVYMLMSVPMGIAYYKTRNIWYPIGIHLLNNLMSYLIIMLLPHIL